MSNLKGSDIAILNYLFDPNVTGKYNIYDQLKEDSSHSENDDQISPEILKVQELEVKGIKLAEEGNLEKGIEVFSEALEIAESASGFNNRAQAYRLKGDDESAMNDLQKALELSKYKGKIGCQALCQRGLIYRKTGAIEKARADFTAAASLGSSFAKKQLVDINPYAAMCNQMMKQMLTPKNEI